MASEEEAMAYSRGAVERAMKVQEVILRAIDGKLTWGQAADILGYSPRTIRRIRWRLQHYGYDGLFDRRQQTPSPKRAPVAEVQRLLALYREHYLGFNVRHFHQLARREHGVRFCYAFVKKALQTAGLVAKHQPRGRHRRRREPRPLLRRAPASRWQSSPLAGVAPRAVVHPHRGGRRRHQARAVRPTAGGRRERSRDPDGGARGARALRRADGALHRPRPLGRPYPHLRERARSPASHAG